MLRNHMKIKKKDKTMSIHTAPFKNPNYILLNQREHNRINPNKQQGLYTTGTGYCSVCGRETHYNNQELCYICRNHLIRGSLFEEYGELVVYGQEYKKYYHLVTDSLVNQINVIMDTQFKTRTYKAKTAKMIGVMKKYIEAEGSIEPDVAYRRLRYYALTERRDSLQKTLQTGKKLFNVLFIYLVHSNDI